jgi:hypothetical protein
VDRAKSVEKDVLQQVVEVGLRPEQARKKRVNGVDVPLVDASSRAHLALPRGFDQEGIVVFDGLGEYCGQGHIRFAGPCGASNHGF